MNRLLLVGNGFDLAHKMKTKYEDFIFWYVKTAFTKAYKGGQYDDELMVVRKINWSGARNPENEEDIKYFFSFLKERPKYVIAGAGDYGRRAKDYEWDAKHGFIEHLMTTCYACGWVDIENEYYDKLKEILTSESGQKGDQVRLLNNAL